MGKLSTLDLFCGAGGFSLGLQESGLLCIGAVDWIRSLRRPTDTIFLGSIYSFVIFVSSANQRYAIISLVSTLLWPVLHARDFR